jgi:Ca-activated chloride channel family protein
MELQFAFPWTQAPWWLAAGVAVLAAVIAVLRALERKREARLHNFVDAQLAPRLLVGYDARVRRPLFWLTVAGAAMLLLTLAQPHWGKSWVQVERGSRDIMVLLDTSESMNAENPLPNRLERARQKIKSMLALCPGDRFGLVAFSGGAALQCPLTMDHGYFVSVLGAVDTDTLSEEGTDIAAAFREAEKAFEDDDQGAGGRERESRAILLLSDGEQVTGDGVKAAAEAAGYARIYVIGIGDPKGAEVTFPRWMLQYIRAKDTDKPHFSRLDESTLSKIAVDGGGVYVRSTPDNADVNLLHSELENIAARAVSGDLRFNRVNRYRWPLSLALLCFAGEGLWLAAMPWIRRWRMNRASRRSGEARHV